MRHEDDWVPMLLWIVVAVAVSIVAHMVAVEVFDAMGYSSMTRVTFVGGGEVSYAQMKESEYLAGPFVQMPALLLTFGAFWLNNERSLSDE